MTSKQTTPTGQMVSAETEREDSPAFDASPSIGLKPESETEAGKEPFASLASDKDIFRLSRREIRELLGGIYKQCCEDESVDLKELGDLLEYLAEELEVGDKYDCWNRIKLDAKIYDRPPYLEQLGQLKAAYFQKLTDKIIKNLQQLSTTAPREAFELWRREYLSSLARWQNAVYLPLCEAGFSFMPAEKAIQQQFRQFNALVTDNKWVEAYPVFCQLAGDESLPAYERTCFEIASGEICLYWMPDFNQALPHFERAEALGKSNDTMRAFGRYYSKKQDLEQARNFLLSAISLGPHNVSNYLQLGDTYKDENKPDVAAQWYNDAWNTNFTNVTTFSKLMNITVMKNPGETAVQSVEDLLKKAAALELDGPYNFELYALCRDAGYYFSEQKNVAQSKRFYQQAIDLKPTLTSAIIDLAYICISAEDYEPAEKWFSKALQLKHGDFDANWGLAWMHDRKEEPLLAEKAYLACLASRESWADTINNVLGDLFYSQVPGPEGQAKAIGYYKAAIEKNGDNVLYQENLLKVLEDAGDVKEVEQRLLQLHNKRPENAGYLASLGKLYVNAGRFEEATVAYEKAVAMEPDNVLNREQLGLCYQATGNTKAAEESFQRCLELTNDYIYTNRLGIFYYQQEQQEKAEAYYRKAIELRPVDAVLWENLALCLEKQERFDEAEKAYLEADRLDKESGRYLHLAGLLWFNRQDYEKAARYYQQAIEKEPENVNYLTDLATSYLSMAQWQPALPLLQQLVNFYPDDHRVVWSLGLAYYYTGQYQLALESLLPIREKMEKDVSWYQFAGLCYEMLQQPDQALKLYSRAVELAPENDNFQNRMGLLHLQSPEPEMRKEAKLHFAKAAELSPNNTIYRHNLARALCEDQQYQEAEHIYQTLEAAEPENHLLKNNYGVLFFNTGRLQEAVGKYKEAIALCDNDPLYYTNLGVAYESMQKPDLAYEAYQKAIALEQANNKTKN